jgi:hypothetical protein
MAGFTSSALPVPEHVEPDGKSLQIARPRSCLLRPSPIRSLAFISAFVKSEYFDSRILFTPDERRR